MNIKHPLSSEEISAIVDGFDPIDVEEMEMLAKLPPSECWLVICRKSEEIRSDLRHKLTKDFPELSLPEINMKVLRSLTPVRIGKNYTEPAYHESGATLKSTRKAACSVHGSRFDRLNAAPTG
jgi:hypothetical protein